MFIHHLQESRSRSFQQHIDEVHTLPLKLPERVAQKRHFAVLAHKTDFFS